MKDQVLQKILNLQNHAPLKLKFVNQSFQNAGFLEFKLFKKLDIVNKAFHVDFVIKKSKEVYLI